MSEPSVHGVLMDGRRFTVRHDPVHGLCLTIDDVNFGCDDVGPVLPADADPTTARVAAEESGSPLTYGYLPDNAVAVVVVLDDGRRFDNDIVTGGSHAMWAVPLPSGAVAPFESPSVLYVAPDGTETPAPTPI